MRERKSPEQIFDDMLADDHSLEEIGERLHWTPLQTRQRYLTVCRKLGVKPDEDA